MNERSKAVQKARRERRLGAALRENLKRRKAQAKIADVDEKIRHLQGIRRALFKITAACSGQGPIGKCSVIQALSDGKPA